MTVILDLLGCCSGGVGLIQIHVPNKTIEGDSIHAGRR